MRTRKIFLPTLFLVCADFFCGTLLLVPFCWTVLLEGFWAAACWGRAAGLGPFLRCVVEGGTTLLGTVVAEVLGPRLLGAAAASGSDSEDPLQKHYGHVGKTTSRIMLLFP